MASRATPTATYRLQMRQEQPYAAATALIPYLRDLGISDLYLSPIATAQEGSGHGYDVVDPRRLNPELGSPVDLRAMLDELARAGMGLLLDVVPNHMCISGDANAMWLDVLENGPSSRYARFFDIDWQPPKAELQGKVLLPVLGEQYGRVLEEGLSLAYQDGRFFVSWGNHTRLPLAPRSHFHLLAPALETLRARLGDEEPRVLELESVIRALSHLPERTETAPARVRERRHEREAIRQRLCLLYDGSEEVRVAIAGALALVGGRRGEPRSFDRLEALMADQGYRLAHWRVAAHEINYRRFFDINELAAIRVEDPEVFAVVHALALEVAAHPAFTGFRIDHVDGLLDPERYLSDLQRRYRAATGREGQKDARCYIVVEKILTGPEGLPEGWDCDGTTGYDFIGLVAGALVKGEAASTLRQLARAAGDDGSYDDTVYRTKRLMLRNALAAELTVLARRLDKISEQQRYTRDFTLQSLQQALSELIACFPAYRTYIRRQDATINVRDRELINKALSVARRRNPLINRSIFEFIGSVLLLEDPEGLSPEARAERRDWVLKFQQLTGPVVAKGVEDTAFYRYLPLVALNEVGGEPAHIGTTLAAFHHGNVRRLARMPRSLSATATHDTKRGEETRTRLYTLSEIPGEWSEACERWRALNRQHKSDIASLDEPAPDAAEEYFLYQTLVGSWPVAGFSSEADYPERVKAYMRKARNEAKIHTSWINPNQAYDEAAERFVDALLDPSLSGPFLRDVDGFVARLVRPGLWSSLTQVLLKVACPGVPDFYQGCELWDFSLVDPDNRRPVDFERRRRLLAELIQRGEGRGTAFVDEVLATPEDGRVKMLVTARALRLRGRCRALFEEGAYEAATALGPRADHVIAFARTRGDDVVIAVGGRFYVDLMRDKPLRQALPVGELWAGTTLGLPAALAKRPYRDALTGRTLQPSADGGRLSLEDVLAHLPVALLEGT